MKKVAFLYQKLDSFAYYKKVHMQLYLTKKGE